MGDAIKRLFHRRYRSTDKDFKPLQSFPYRDAVPGTPPRKGDAPLHGDFSYPPGGPFGTSEENTIATRHQRSVSVGSVHGHPRQTRLRKAVSDASARGRLDMNLDMNGRPKTIFIMPPIASPPLPGTAVTSDDARYWRDVDGSADIQGNANINGNSSNNCNAHIDGDASESFRKMSLGGDSRYGEDVADRNLTEHFPKPSSGPVTNHAEDTADRYAVGDAAPFAIPPRTSSRRDRASFSLPDGDAFPESLPVRSANTQSRLFLEDSSDEEASEEHGHRHSPASLRRKKGHRGLRNISNPRNDYSVQAPARTPGYFDGMMNGMDGYDLDRASSSYLIDDTPKQSLDGVVDLRDTEDITYHSRYAPAVTHETIHPEVHHIREERIFREIHTHDVFHRVLPIIDVEVLPARHFVPTEDGELREMPEADIPGRSNDDQARNWLVAEVVSRITRDDETPVGPRHFTAREFHGTQGDERRYTTEEGFETTETTWVHPPTIETGAKESGQTEPLYMRSPVPDGHMCGGLETVEEEEEFSQQKSLRDLAGGVRDCPFEECAKFENKGDGGAHGKLVV